MSLLTAAPTVVPSWETWPVSLIPFQPAPRATGFVLLGFVLLMGEKQKQKTFEALRSVQKEQVIR